MEKKVLVAMSGGVDSTYAAVSLKEQGYDIIGVTFKINDSEATNTSIFDAEKICQLLGIQHFVVNYQELFQTSVFDYFIHAYQSGITPNPCVICNKVIKFGALNELRKKLNLDYIATGHYAQIEKIENHYYIKRAANLQKDQSYFLNQIPKDMLQYMLFPLGQVNNKEEVREYLRHQKIELAEKKESQEICFVDTKKLNLFLNEYIVEKKGNIIKEKNIIVGKHTGAFKYTIGQRKGLGIVNDLPLYVTKIDSNKNIVYVGTEKELYKNIAYVDQVNIFSENMLENGHNLYGKVRYRTELAKINKIEFQKDSAKICFEENQRSITPGQYIVIYCDDYLVLGARIIKTED